MAKPIESYIRANQDTVNKWLTSFFSSYIIICSEADKQVAQYVSSLKICTDARRLPKVMEVLRHYNLIDNQRWVSSPYRSERYSHEHYDILVNRDSFLKMAPSYGVKHDFKVESPNGGGSRIESYPFLKDIPSQGVIYYYFHQDEYVIYNQTEYTVNGFGKRVKSSPTDSVKIYPKNLESKAERAAFEAAMESYFSHNLECAIEILCGFTPEVLTFSSEKNSWDGDMGDTLRNMPIRRCGKLMDLDAIDKEQVKDKLAYAKRLKLYAEACIRDLTKLSPVVTSDSSAFKKKLFKKAEPELLIRAPLMLGDPNTKDLANMLLKGSNKGII